MLQSLMALLPLRRNRKYSGDTTLVDDEDIQLILNHSPIWRIGDHSPYPRSDIAGKIISLHRLLMNASEGQIVDHINGNPLDNRRANLRLVTFQQNIWNSKKRITNETRSKYKGVSQVLKTGNWRAYISLKVEGKTTQKNLGAYKTEDEAASAYNAAAREHFGEYARLNDLVEINFTRLENNLPGETGYKGVRETSPGSFSFRVKRSGVEIHASYGFPSARAASWARDAYLATLVPVKT